MPKAKSRTAAPVALLAVCVFVGLPTASGAAQTLTVSEALVRALESSPTVRAAAAQVAR